MAMQKKSLVGNLSTTKNATVAKGVASAAPVRAPKLQTAKPGPGIGGHRLNSAKPGPGIGGHHQLISAKKK